jgi:hypothetical protein
MPAKTGLDALLRPEDSILVLIDHQPFQFANLNSHAARTEASAHALDPPVAQLCGWSHAPALRRKRPRALVRPRKRSRHS